MCFCASRRRHTICALVTGVQTCALPISSTLIAMAATSFSAAVAASEPDRDPGTVPYDLAFEKREFRLNDEASVSPDGTRVAYVVLTPPEVRTQQGRFLPNGKPVNAEIGRAHV